MKPTNPFMQTFDELPETLPIFPLSNAVVLPGSILPLNIFEPRYINMVQDALKTHRLIGMIQPRDETTESPLFDIGCAARITRFEETNDGRLEISLTGICRFEIEHELETIRGYRFIVPNWDKFQSDYTQEIVDNPQSTESFVHALKHYFEQTEFKLDWKVIAKLNPIDIFNSLYGFIDLSPTDKQMLLEIDTHQERIKVLTVLLNSNFELDSNSRKH